MIEFIIKLCGVSAIFIIALIFLFLLREGLPALTQVAISDFADARWYPIGRQIRLHTVAFRYPTVTAGAVIIAVPLGLVTAIYLGEIALTWLRDILKPLIEILAGIPSIVLGFLGWLVLAPLIQKAGAPTGLIALTGSLILGYGIADYHQYR